MGCERQGGRQGRGQMREIQAERDLARLERWLERAIMARSIAEVIGDAS